MYLGWYVCLNVSLALLPLQYWKITSAGVSEGAEEWKKISRNGGATPAHKSTFFHASTMAQLKKKKKNWL